MAIAVLAVVIFNLTVYGRRDQCPTFRSQRLVVKNSCGKALPWSHVGGRRQDQCPVPVGGCLAADHIQLCLTLIIRSTEQRDKMVTKNREVKTVRVHITLFPSFSTAVFN